MSENRAASFDLTKKPWIQVLGTDGRRREVSITELFREAENLREIVGEIPTQGFAILRLLLAVLHRAVEGPASVADWVRIRDDWKQTVADVEEYLDEHRHRFDLRHAAAPFYQVADLRTGKNKAFELKKIIADVPDGHPYLTPRTGRGIERISWAEAARWLVHVHAFDTAGILSGAVGDPRVRDGKGYGIGTGWAGMLGGLFLRGETLKETLLLNLVGHVGAGLEISGDDVPVWEREPHGPAPEGRPPAGPVCLYTWQSRRVRLVGDDVGVTAVVLAQGDRNTPQNQHHLEPLTAWRYSKAQTAKAKGKRHTYMPREHDPARAMWRGLPGLLAGQGEKNGIEPGVLRWAAVLEADGHLPNGALTVQAVGIKYGTNNSVVEELVHDHLDLPPEIVAHGDGAAAHLARRAVDQAQLAVSALANLAQNLYLAAGGNSDSDGPATRAREAGYHDLEQPFRRWLLKLEPDTDITELERAWQSEVRGVVARIGRELAEGSGPAAFVGRKVRGKQMDLGVAEVRFWSRLRKDLPLAVRPADTESDRDNEEHHDG
ncbi:type I-E CRISPR-associated protein Cse1/CasA [Promicromonospora sp. NFX87]|uniref:type I-E CRISPR-associated protein Cse1/CasA n=1 Tax=Promicromonospora sp. NFX87 TaxID=3402691 RepID=UPI003AFAE8A9